jgi:acyl carrier protein
VADLMQVDKSEITRETNFVRDLNTDIIDEVKLCMEFEDAFDMTIPDEDAETFETVGQAIDYIEANTK